MITLAALFVFLGFMLCYFTSEKAALPKMKFVGKVKENMRFAKLTGVLLLLWAMVLAIVYSGLATGILTFFILLMTLGSLVVLCVPLRVINVKVIIPFFIIAAVLELLLT